MNNKEYDPSEPVELDTLITEETSVEELLLRLQGGDTIHRELDAAIDEFLTDIKHEHRYDTYLNHKSVLDRFQEWVEAANSDDDASEGDTTDDIITAPEDLHGSHFQQFKDYLRDRDNQTISLNGALSSFRVFIKFCERNDYLATGASEKVPVPQTDDEDEIRTDPPSEQLVTKTSEYLTKHKYASRQHVEFEIIREFGMRVGAVRAIDESDYHYDEGYIELHHRPEGHDEKGTPLKNGGDSERELTLPTDLNELIHDYLQSDPVRRKHDDIVDQYDRQPLLTVEDNKGNPGRPSVTTIRRDFYKMTRPCKVGMDCPEGRDPADCEAEKNAHAAKCPPNTSSHPLRTWSIMNQLDQLPKSLISDRCDVSVPVLEQHYDHRNESRKRRKRATELAKHMPRYEAPSDQELPADDTADPADTPVSASADDAAGSTANNQSADSPIAYIRASLVANIELPTPLDWLVTDITATIREDQYQPPATVRGLVGAHGILTVAVYLLTFLMS